MTKFVAFDLETFAIPVDGEDWKTKRLGISCADIAYRAHDGTIAHTTWFGPIDRPMDVRQCHRIAKTLLDSVGMYGGTLVTVNGCGFDFRVLADECNSGLMTSNISNMSLENHIDLMLIPLCHYGWPVGLSAFAKGAGVADKLKTVTLKDGSQLTGMDGAKAPELWQAGETEAVLTYLRQDTETTLLVAEKFEQLHHMKWFSKKGKPYYYDLVLFDGKLPKAIECLSWANMPDQSWMTNPITRASVVEWMPERIKAKCVT